MIKIDVAKGAVLSCLKARREAEATPFGESRKGLSVKKPNLKKPSKVERARARLDSAVARLEEALDRRLDSLPDAAGKPTAETPSALVVELESLRDENAKLKGLNEIVTTRLDAAIGRLRTAIGN